MTVRAGGTGFGAELAHMPSPRYELSRVQACRSCETLYNMGGKRPSRPATDLIKQVYRVTVMHISRLMCLEDQKRKECFYAF